MSRIQRRLEAKLSRKLVQASQKHQRNLFKTLPYKVDVSTKMELAAAIDGWLEANCTDMRVAQKAVRNQLPIVEIGFASASDCDAFKKFLGVA